MALPQRIQVIHFVEDLEKGGLENVVFQIVTRLDKELFDVRVVCRIKGGYTANEIIKQGVPLKILHENRIPIWKIRGQLKALRTNEEAIFHCHGLFSSSSETIFAPRSGYRSVFVHVHNLENPNTIYRKFKLHILKKSVNKFITVSDKVNNCLFENSVRNIQTIHNGIDMARYQFKNIPKKGEHGFHTDTFVLGMVGRIVKRKGFDHFIEIIRNTPNTSGLIVGSGPYEGAVKEMISRNRLHERIRCIPFQPQDRLPDIYLCLDAFFLFSEKEGLPLALIESQAVGVPYIGNAVGGIGEVVKDGFNGFILEEVHMSQIEEIISKIRNTPSYYRGNARKAVQEDFSVHNMVRSIESLYIESLSQ